MSVLVFYYILNDYERLLWVENCCVKHRYCFIKVIEEKKSMGAELIWKFDSGGIKNTIIIIKKSYKRSSNSLLEILYLLIVL